MGYSIVNHIAESDLWCCPISYDAEGCAFYRSGDNTIHIQSPKYYKTDEDFNSELLHEKVYSMMNPLERKQGKGILELLLSDKHTFYFEVEISS